MKADFSKGSYTFTADVTVYTNSNFESHFGLTAVSIDGTPYTFGMLANGQRSTNTISQTYKPYYRKGNNNNVVAATGSNINASNSGTTVKIKAVVSNTQVSYYLDGNLAATV